MENLKEIVEIKDSKIMEFFLEDSCFNLYTALFQWQGHCLASQAVYSGIMSKCDAAYEWWKSLHMTDFSENDKYFGITFIPEGDTEQYKYYIKKSVVQWGFDNCKTHRHLANLIKKNFKFHSHKVRGLKNPF